MVAFVQVAGSHLYQIEGSGTPAGWWGIVLDPAADPPQAAISLADALSDKRLRATFIFFLAKPDVMDPQRAAALTEKVATLLADSPSERAFIWFTSMDFEAASYPKTPLLPLTPNGKQVPAGMRYDLSGVEQLFVNVVAGAHVHVDGDAIVFEHPTHQVIVLDGPAAPDTSPPKEASLSFTGDDLGAIRLRMNIRRLSLHDKLNWGCQYVVPNPAASGGKNARVSPYLTVWLPLASGGDPNPNDNIAFSLRLNPADPNNSNGSMPPLRTVFFFTGQNSDGNPTVLASGYRTAFGERLLLYPLPASASDSVRASGLVVNPSSAMTEQQQGFRFAPVGDFAAGLEQTAEAYGGVLCGLAGSESIGFFPRAHAGGYDGDRLRFTPNQPAYAAEFPIESVSPLGPPFNADKKLLQERFLTSWATVVAGPGAKGAPHYTAAPKGADLFGKDGVVNSAVPLLLGPKGPGATLDDPDLAFPLSPYADVVPGDGVGDLDAENLQLLEKQILAPTRRTIISKATSARAPSARSSLASASHADDEIYNATTPTGLVAMVEGGRFKKLVLGQVMPAQGGTVPERQLAFLTLQQELQEVFQTSDLFLVGANPRYLGQFSDGTDRVKPGETPTFCNVITIGEWKLTAAIGRNPGYGDYRNVMIVKGVRGKLTDLVKSPDKWSRKDLFAAPTNAMTADEAEKAEPQPSQLLPLSDWLGQYFDDALNRDADNEYFENFKRIIQSDDWTGILFLKLDLSQIPDDLAGIAAGVGDPGSFYAHHLGIEVSPIDGKEIELCDSSSIFGLVYYVDPQYEDGSRQVIAPSNPGATYDFTLLTLKVLFENTAVKRFESLAQASLNVIAGAKVKGMGEGGNVYNAILLEGAYQRRGNSDVYSLASTSTNAFYMENDVFTKAEVTSATLSTRDDGDRSGRVVSWLAMSGYLAFAVLTTADEKAFDVFSYGSDQGKDEPGEGLAFSGLGLRISFSTKNPEDRSIELSTGEIAFNAGASRARDDSIARSFQLELQGLVSGQGEETPAKLGYLVLGSPQLPLPGVDGSAWHGLTYTINLGTPGTLAGKVNLSSTLVTAWKDQSGVEGSGPEAVLGLKLPGTGGGSNLFSLQTVISVSVGPPLLFFNEEKRSFLLLLSQLALKLLGLLKIPPNGATSFFLFGDKTVTDSSGLGWLAVYNQDQPKS